MLIDDDAISDAKKYFFKSDGHQTRIYYPLTHCNMAYTFNHTLCIYLFVLRIFIDYPQQGYNYLLKHTSFLVSYLALIE